jgi:hypothetical protein
MEDAAAHLDREKENVATESHAVDDDEGVQTKRNARPSSERDRKRSKSSRGDANRSDLDNHPFNVPQYRFTPVYPDPRGVTLSPYDRAPQLRLSDENLSVSGHKGYRLVRATHGVETGAWYCEATIREDVPETGLNERCDAPPPRPQTPPLHGLASIGLHGRCPVCPRLRYGPSHRAECLICATLRRRFTKVAGSARIGWARGSAYMQAPIAYDRFGYCICSASGSVVAMRRPRSYGRAMKVGDVVGCYISLPPRAKEEPAAGGESGEDGAAEGAGPEGASDKAGASDILEWKGSGRYYFLDEDKDTGEETHAGSVIRFFLNGEPLGEAFRDVQARPGPYPSSLLPPLSWNISALCLQPSLPAPIPFDAPPCGAAHSAAAQAGKYFPAVSPYFSGQVSYNFGPSFKFPLGDAQPDGVRPPACSKPRAASRPRAAGSAGARGCSTGGCSLRLCAQLKVRPISDLAEMDVAPTEEEFKQLLRASGNSGQSARETAEAAADHKAEEDPALGEEGAEEAETPMAVQGSGA